MNGNQLVPSKYPATSDPQKFALSGEAACQGDQEIKHSGMAKTHGEIHGVACCLRSLADESQATKSMQLVKRFDLELRKTMGLSVVTRIHECRVR